MKKLAGKLGIFLLIEALLIAIIILFSAKPPLKQFITEITGSAPYAEKLNASNEVITYIKKVEKAEGTTKLIVGDSVCNSLFGELQENNPEFCIVGCNKGITMAGQYILTKKYLDAHPDATDVYLVAISNALITGFDTDFGYQYAVMPFALTDSLELLDENTIKEMEKLYFKPFLRKDVINFVDASPLVKKLYLNLEKQIHPTTLKLEFPEVTIQYILKMYELCEAQGVTMHFIPPPLADTKERRGIEDILQNEYETSALYQVFPDYYESYLYDSPELFGDGIHPSVSRDEKDDMVRSMMKKSGHDWGLVFE